MASQVRKCELLSTFNTRKFGYCASEIHQNFIFLYERVSSIEQMTVVTEFVNTMRTRFNKENLAVEIPAAFNSLKGSNTKMEVTISDSL